MKRGKQIACTANLQPSIYRMERVYRGLKSRYTGGTSQQLIRDYSYDNFVRVVLPKYPIPDDPSIGRWSEGIYCLTQSHDETFRKILEVGLPNFNRLLDTQISNRSRFTPSPFLKRTILSDIDGMIDHKTSIPILLGNIAARYGAELFASWYVRPNQHMKEHPYVLFLTTTLTYFSKRYHDTPNDVVSKRKFDTFREVARLLNEDYEFCSVEDLDNVVNFALQTEHDYYREIFDESTYSEEQINKHVYINNSDLGNEWREYLRVLIGDPQAYYGSTVASSTHAIKHIWEWTKKKSESKYFRAFLKLRVLLKFAYLDIGCKAEGDLWDSDFGRVDINQAPPVYQDNFALKKDIMGDVYKWGLSYLFVKEKETDLAEVVQKFPSQVAEVVTEYKEVFRNCTWMSEQTKQQCINKLDRMHCGYAHPEKFKYGETSEYEDIPVDKNDIVEIYIDHFTRRNRHTFSKLGKNFDRDDWQLNHVRQTWQYNAMNALKENAIYFTANFCVSADVVDWRRYTFINVAAHEISHSFDTNGRYFDEYAVRLDVPSWTPAEVAEYTLRMEQSIAYTLRRTETVSHALSREEAGRMQGSVPNMYLPRRMAQEAIADVFALQVVGSLMDKKYPDKKQRNKVLEAVFSDHASHLGGVMTERQLRRDTENAPHIITLLRGNYGLKHCPHFYEVYGNRLASSMKIERERMLNMWGDAPHYKQFAEAFVLDMILCCRTLCTLFKERPGLNKIVFIGFPTVYLYHASLILSAQKTPVAPVVEYVKALENKVSSDTMVVFVATQNDKLSDLHSSNDHAVQLLQIPTDGPDNISKPWCRLANPSNAYVLSPYVGDLLEKVFSVADEKVDDTNPYLRLMYNMQ